MGEDVILAVHTFFSTGFLLKAWNATALTLVPKPGCPTSMRDYIPIACCNVVQ